MHAELNNRIVELMKQKGADSRIRPLKENEPLRRFSGQSTLKIDAFYDSAKKTFWTRNARGEFMDVKETCLKRILRSNGFSNAAAVGHPLTEVEDALLQIQVSRDVHYAGPLAGFGVGLYEILGNRVLVTRDPIIVKPAKGKYGLLDWFFKALLGAQHQHFYGWMKSARKSLKAGAPFRPGQLLALAGPGGCGKSLTQLLVTEMLGGRCAKPYQYMIGETTFNANLFESEHLAIEDEAASTELSTRRYFGASIKNLLVNEVQNCHGKTKTQLSLTPFWRVSITLNDEPENLMVLPPMDESIRDKVILLKASMVDFPYEEDDLTARRRFREQLSQEVPAFLAMLEDWQIPRPLRDRRYGVKAWHHPELMNELDALAPEFRLLALIDALVFDMGSDDTWSGTAAKLERELRDRDKKGEVDRLLKYNTACGSYLARLKAKLPARVESKILHGQKIWNLQKAPPLPLT